MKTQSALAVIEKKSTKDLVVDRVREAILKGELSSGQRVTEPELAGNFGVGQATVREALIELEHMGFVQRREPRKTFITHLTHEDIAQIYAVRVPLEFLAIEMAAAAHGDLSALDDAIEKMESAAKKGDLAGFKSADHNFHRALWQAAGNPYIVECLEPLVTKLFAFAYTTIGDGRPAPEKRLDLVAAHRDITAFLRAGDASAAKDALRDSMDMSWTKDEQPPARS
jgi:DNA-binding GntR family transcriptional regulator